MDDALAVISASTDNIDVMHSVMRECAEAKGTATDDLRPEQWLETFYERRKGSGKSQTVPATQASNSHTAQHSRA